MCSPSLHRIQPRHRGTGIGVQTGRLLGQRLLARGREPVVATQPAVHDLFAVDRDQLVLAKSVQRRIQRPGPQSDSPVRDLLDVGDDPVAMLAASGQRRQDQERRLLHRPSTHAENIYRTTNYGQASVGGSSRLCTGLGAKPYAQPPAASRALAMRDCRAGRADVRFKRSKTRPAPRRTSNAVPPALVFIIAFSRAVVGRSPDDPLET